MVFGSRGSSRVEFSNEICVQIVGVDGTWHRKGKMLDISATGAKLKIDNSLAGLDLAEFFLFFSTMGSVYRRCKLVRLFGDQIGVEFLELVKSKKAPAVESISNEGMSASKAAPARSATDVQACQTSI